MLLEPLNKPLQALHLAGIVPVAGQERIFNMPWHDSLMPIAPDYTAVEKAVFECAAVGCETIWVVAHIGTIPLLKKRINDFVSDPFNENINKYKVPREIPIYYVPIHPRDRELRDCLGWSVMYGAKAAYGTSSFLSKWIAPELFYCSFPYSMNDINESKKIRTKLFNKQKILFSFNNKTVKDNMHLNFSFDAKDYFSCTDILRKKDLNEFDKLKIKTKNYDLKTVFKCLDEQKMEMIELSWYYDLTSWDSYREYLNTDYAKNLKKDYKFFTKKKKIKYIEYMQKNELKNVDNK